MDIKDMIGRTPVNKTAALVTNQSGCDDNIFIDGKQKLKALGAQKRHYADMSAALKAEIGVTRKIQDKGRVPRHIHRHPKFPLLLDIMSKLTAIDKDIKHLRDSLKKGFQPDWFINKVKQKYPAIYAEIMEEIRKENDY